MFQTARPRRSVPSVVTSLFLHCAGILLLCVVSFPSSPLRLPTGRMLAQIQLTAPSPTPSIESPSLRTPEPPPKLIPALRRFQAPSPRAPELKPKLAFNLPPTPVLEPVRVAVPAPAPAAELPRLASPVRTGTFDAQSIPVRPGPPPAVPEVNVKAAGFASAEHTAAEASPRRVAATSGFEAAAPEAVTRRAGVARVSGFAAENALPVTNSVRPVAHNTGAFGDTSVAAPSAITAHRTAAPATASLEILDKPRPSYTEEARRLNIEGEVLLEVVFQASGQTQVVRVVRGLGHGLDESAMAAARQIHFRPAQRDGAAIDSSAVVHIMFQLAY